MKRKLLKQLGFALTIAISTPVFVQSSEMTIANAAVVKTPNFAVKTKTIKGIGTNYTLQINNKIDKAKYSWSSSNSQVATVNYKGIITTVKKGTATIKCVVTKPDKTKITLTCKVTVKVPAKGVTISNKVEQDGVHIIYMGDTYDFNRKLSPSGSTDKTYWTIKDTSIATVNSSGVVTPKKEGTTILTATAANSKSAMGDSKIKDETIIRITKKTAEVASIGLTGGNELEVKFSSAVNPTTIYDPITKELKSVVSITPTEDANKTNASNPGNLTGELSEDGMTLIITSEDIFNGYYDIKLSSDIMTMGNIALKEYRQNIRLVDNIEPFLVGTETDDTGVIITFKFSEPIDTTYFDIVDVKPANLDAATTGTLKNSRNYLLSNNKKELKIDLSNLSHSGESKTNYTVQFSGIKDLAGNTPKNLFITAAFVTDTTPKPQAKIVSITRTGYNTLTILHDRAIQTAGFVTMNGNEVLNGTVDADNKKQVNYTLTQEQALLTGTVKVSVGYWNGYNVSASDTSADRMTDRDISFAIEQSAPKLTNWKLDTTGDNNTIQLIFSKSVVIVKSSGSLSSKIKTASDDIISNLNLNYKAIANDNTVTVTLDNRQMSDTGQYSVVIPSGIVKDKYNNLNEETTISLTKNVGSSNSTTGRTINITQSESDPSIIRLAFDYKLDISTAQTVSNYTVKGAVITKAEVTQNNDNGAIVELTFAPGQILYTTNYEMVINGVKSYSGTNGTLTNYKVNIMLKENIVPTVTNCKIVGGTTVEITFSENIKGTAGFDVYQNGSILSSDIQNTYYIDGSKLVISLYYAPSGASPTLTLNPTNGNSLTDLDGNPAVLTTLSAR